VKIFLETISALVHWSYYSSANGEGLCGCYIVWLRFTNVGGMHPFVACYTTAVSTN
jgi:hypothetical protein